MTDAYRLLGVRPPWASHDCPGRQVGRVRLNHEPVGRNLRKKCSKFCASPLRTLVADPPRDADVQVQGKAVPEILWAASEAMDDSWDPQRGLAPEEGRRCKEKGILS